MLFIFKYIFLYIKVDKFCPSPYSLPLASSANLTATRFAPSFGLGNELWKKKVTQVCDFGRAFSSQCLIWRGGLDGLDEWDGEHLCPLIFFILRYIKHYIKVVRPNFLWVLNFGQVGGSNKKIQKHPLGWVFLKSY